MEITEATLLKSKQETYSRDTCIFRTFIITNDIYHRMEDFGGKFNEIKKEHRKTDKDDDTRHKGMKRMVESLITKLSEIDNNTYNYFRVTFIMMVLLSVLNIALWLVIK